MITLNLTKSQAEDVLYATSLLYMEYVDSMGAEFNQHIRTYNDQVDELRQTIKDQLKEQEWRESQY